MYNTAQFKLIDQQLHSDLMSRMIA